MTWKQRLKQILPLQIQNIWRVRQELKHGEPELHLLPVLCRADQTTVDIGANVGIYTHIARQYSGHVLAIEPQPQLAASLRAAYGAGGHVTVEACGLSDQAGTFQLYVPVVRQRRIDTRASLLPGLNSNEEASLDVPVRTLDSFGLKDVGLIKIDVEGLELKVLRGATETLTRCRPTVIVEAEERMQAGTVASVIDFMRALNFDGFFIYRDTLHSVDEFAAEQHQAPGSHVAVGESQSDDYVNNFLFISAEAAEIKARAKAAVAGVALSRGRQASPVPA